MRIFLPFNLKQLIDIFALKNQSKNCKCTDFYPVCKIENAKNKFIL